MQLMKKAAAARANMGQAVVDPARRPVADQPPKEGGEAASDATTTQGSEGQNGSAPAVGGTAHAPGDAPVSLPRQPSEYIDEILQVLKTAFPLLILSLETMVDQIQHKFKLSPDEDVYRNICLLLQDAIQVRPMSAEKRTY